MTPGRFDEIVAMLYDAASGRLAWRSALDALATAMDAAACVMLGVDTARSRLVYRWSGGRLGRGRTGSRTGHDMLITDPLLHALGARAPGDWLRPRTTLGADTEPFGSTSHLAPPGGRVVACVRLLDAHGVSTLFALCRASRQRALDEDDFAILERLGHHLAVALAIYRANGAPETEPSEGLVGVRASRHPMLLVDDQRRILHRNPAAEALLRDSPTLCEQLAHLVCVEADDDSALLQTLSQLELFAQRPPGGAGERAVIRLGQHPRGETTVVFASAMRGTSACEAFGRSALAMLLLHCPGRSASADPELIAEAFELTPAEARVAAQLAQGFSADQIAAQRTVSTQTIRAQIRAVFEKTGINRQADLIRMLVEMPGASHRAPDEDPPD